MGMSDAGEFVHLLTKNQSRLYAYIFSLMGNSSQADDILQESNTVLWKKREQFKPGTDFAAWMLKIAYLQVMVWRQKRVREKLIFDSPLIQELSQVAEERLEQSDERRASLRQCLEKLSPRHRDLVLRRYSADASMERISQELGFSAEAAKQALFRARIALIECIKRTAQEAKA